MFGKSKNFMVGIFLSAILALACVAVVPAQGDWDPDFLEFYGWVEEKIVARPINEYDAIEIAKLMGYLVRKQMELHNVHDEYQQTIEDQQNLQRLNNVYQEYFKYAEWQASGWSNDSGEAWDWTQMVWDRFAGAFLGVDMDQLEGFDLDRDIETKWGINPSNIPDIYAPEPDQGDLNDLGWENMLGAWIWEQEGEETVKDPNDSNNWVTRKTSQRYDLVFESKARKFGREIKGTGVYGGDFWLLQGNNLYLLDGIGTRHWTLNRVNNNLFEGTSSSAGARRFTLRR